MILALRNRVYLRLFSAQVFSLLGTGLMTVALALIAYQLGGERGGVVLGLIFTIKMIAYVGFAPVASALADKIAIKPLLIGLDLSRVALAAMLPFVDALWQVYLLVFLFQLCSAAFTPAYQSLIPDILTDEKRYTEALTLSRLAYNLETMFSPILAGVLLFVLAASQLFLGTALAFVFSALLVVSCALPQRVGKVAEKFSKRLRKGFNIYLRTPRLHGLLCVNFAVSLVGAWILVNSVVYSQTTLGGDVQTYTRLMAAYGFGSIIGALSIPWLMNRLETRTVMIGGAALLGLLPLLIMAPMSYPGTLALWGGLGVATSLAITPGGLILTRSAVGTNRPAIFAAQFSLSHGGWLLTYPLAGWLGAWAGLENAFIYMTAGSLFFTLLAVWLWPADDPVERRHTHLETVGGHRFGKGREYPVPPRKRQTMVPFSHKHAFYIDDEHPKWAMKNE